MSFSGQHPARFPPTASDWKKETQAYLANVYAPEIRLIWVLQTMPCEAGYLLGTIRFCHGNMDVIYFLPPFANGDVGGPPSVRFPPQRWIPGTRRN